MCVSALAWGQVALASDYPRAHVMSALHKAVRRVHAASPWAPENTIRAVAHCMPCPRPTAVAAVVTWLEQRATWQGVQYTDTDIPKEFKPKAFEPIWCLGLHLLLLLRS